ncbi:MAG: hypothetical protein ACTSRY_05210, partial [Alphaproteobacteria bacterium]
MDLHVAGKRLHVDHERPPDAFVEGPEKKRFDHPVGLDRRRVGQDLAGPQLGQYLHVVACRPEGQRPVFLAGQASQGIDDGG